MEEYDLPGTREINFPGIHFNDSDFDNIELSTRARARASNQLGQIMSSRCCIKHCVRHNKLLTSNIAPCILRYYRERGEQEALPRFLSIFFFSQSYFFDN